jgi:sulfur-oxidizing protein SoxX
MRRVGLTACLLALVSAAGSAADGNVDRGRAIAHDQQMGNCLACHRMPADPAAVTEANLGPALENLRSRYPDRASLRAQLWDPAAANPDTIMPPYGRHGILTSEEIELVLDYLYGL